MGGVGKLQTVHAAQRYYGKPWFDDVAVKGEDNNGVEEIWYAQLRLLFSWGGRLMAFVRWYAAVDLAQTTDDTLVQHGCISLQWEKKQGGGPLYQVISLDSVLRRVYIVPDFKRNDAAGGEAAEAPDMVDHAFFHVSAFKWDRPVPDKSGFPVAADGEEE